MNRILFYTIILTFLYTAAYSQQRIAAAAANLQLTGENVHGEEVTAISRNLVILYEQGVGKGELDLGSLSSSNAELNDLLAGLKGKILYITFTIPEGRFAFGDSMNERFTTYGQLALDDVSTEFALELDVSNIKDSRKNTFKVLGKGRLSLSEHFCLSADHGLRDNFGFLFNQNLNVFTP